MDNAIIRSIGGMTATVTIEEQHADDVTITEHPVEQGAQIADHAYVNPAQLAVRCGWSNSDPDADSDAYVRDIYQQLLDLKNARQPIEVVTGKRDYDSMLIRALALTTDAASEFALYVTVTLREIILVQTQTTNVPPAANQADQTKTAAVQNTAPAQTIPAPNANSSALAKIFGN